MTVSPESLVKREVRRWLAFRDHRSPPRSSGRRRRARLPRRRRTATVRRPSEQRERIASACERDGLTAASRRSRSSTSRGGAPLDARPGLRRAVELVEAGEADVVVVAYFDRLVRSLAGAARGRRARRAGRRRDPRGRRRRGPRRHRRRAGSPRRCSAWSPSTHRRVTAERTAGREAPRGRARRAAVPEHAARLPQRDEDGRLEPHPKEATIVARGVPSCAPSGATVMEVREHLREQRDRAHVPRRRRRCSPRGSCSASSASASSSTRTRHAAIVDADDVAARPARCARRAAVARSRSGCSRGSASSAAARAARGWSSAPRTSGTYCVVPLPADRRLPAALFN